MTTEGEIPDEEMAEMQREEVDALEAIFENAIDIQSKRSEDALEFPIVYRIKLNEMDVDAENDGTTNWPKRPLVVEIRYPKNYPSDSDDYDLASTIPSFDLLHENTVLEFPSRVSEKLLAVLRETAENERGMPSVLSCLYAARDYLDGEREWQDESESKSIENVVSVKAIEAGVSASSTDIKYACLSTHHLLDHKPDNLLRTGHKCNLRGFYKFGTPGLAIAWGNQDNVDDFLETMKRAMPQKKFELLFSRTWESSKPIPEGWTGVDPPGLREAMMEIGAPEEDYYIALGLEKTNDKQAKSKGKGKSKNKWKLW